MSDLADPPFLSAWFSARLPEHVPGLGSVEVLETRRLSRGVSRETWVVTVEVGGQGPPRRRYVVRRDPPRGTVIWTDLRREHDLYVALGRTDVPVARALWFEEDPRWQPDGRPAAVREHVDGGWHLEVLADDDPAHAARRIALSKSHLAALASVHTADWRSAGFGEILEVPTGPSMAAAVLLDSTLTALATFPVAPDPLVIEAADHLRRTAPTDAPALALCKGTNGHGEEIWRDGVLVAMSDWELAIIGDPAYDFAQLQEMIPEVVVDGVRRWGWPQALAHYRELTGIDISEERLAWYRAAYGLIQYVYAAHAAHHVAAGRADLRLLWTGTEVRHHAKAKLLRGLAESEDAASAGVRCDGAIAGGRS